MKTLDRYIAGTFGANLLLSILGLTAFYVLQNLIGELMDHSYPTEQILVYAALGVPQILSQMTPPSVMMATVFTLSGLNRRNELIACYSIGVGLARVMAVVLSMVFMLSCLMLVMQDRILPPVFKQRTNFYWHEMQKRKDFSLDVKQDKIWYRSKNLIYNLQTFDTKTQTIRGMSVYTFDRDFRLAQMVEAERASYTAKGWRLYNGVVTSFSKDDPFPSTRRFVDKELVLSETPRDFEEIEREVDGLRLKELYRYIERVKGAGADSKGYEVKFHSRMSLSFIPLVMCILGVPFSVRNRREGGVAKDLALCLLITFFYWLFYSVGLSLGTNGALPPWLAAWLPSAIFTALAVTLIARLRI